MVVTSIVHLYEMKKANSEDEKVIRKENELQNRRDSSDRVWLQIKHSPVQGDVKESFESLSFAIAACKVVDTIFSQLSFEMECVDLLKSPILSVSAVYRHTKDVRCV